MAPEAGTIGLFDGYCPHPLAWAAFADNSRNLLMLAGTRGAKTHTGARRFLRLIYENDLPAALERPYSPGAAAPDTAMWWRRRPRLHYWVVGATFDLLREAQRALLDAIPPDLLEHADVSANAIWLKPDILIELKSGQHPERLVAVGLNGMWIDEGARLSPTAWPAFLMARLADKQGWMQCTTTPLGRDWTYDHIELPAKKGEPGYAFHKWNTEDNIRVPALVEQAAIAKRLLPAAYYNREYRADREAFIGQIYEFDEKTMAVDALPKGIQFVRRLGCQDWGFSNPGAHIVIGLTSTDPERAHVWALDEIYDSSQLVEDWWVPEVRKKMRKWEYNEVSADPAEPDNILRFKSAGIHCVGHKNFTNAKWDEHERSVRAGIRTLATLIHQKRFHVMKRQRDGTGCPNLIEELKSYRWDQHKSGPFGGTLIERPAPNQKEHAATACRYGVTYALRGAVFVPQAIKAVA